MSLTFYFSIVFTLCICSPCAAKLFTLCYQVNVCYSPQSIGGLNFHSPTISHLQKKENRRYSELFSSNGVCCPDRHCTNCDIAININGPPRFDFITSFNSLAAIKKHKAPAPTPPSNITAKSSFITASTSSSSSSLQGLGQSDPF